MALILKRSYVLFKVKESYNLRRRENYVQIRKKRSKDRNKKIRWVEEDRK